MREHTDKQSSIKWRGARRRNERIIKRGMDTEALDTKHGYLRRKQAPAYLKKFINQINPWEL